MNVNFSSASTLLAVDFAPVIEPILEVLDAILWPAIAIVGAVGTIYCIILGIKLAKSDEQNSREKAKKDLIGAIVGFVIIFVLIVALKIREMLDGLSKKLPQGATPILHSDQGWQYQHAEYQRYLKEHNIVQSMSRKGN